jgi:hypothetical protein
MRFSRKSKPSKRRTLKSITAEEDIMKIRGLIYGALMIVCMGAGWASAFTEGTGNNFFGINAGANTTSGGNTFVGGSAGKTNILGSYNTYLGYTAGYSNSEGSYNTIIGTQAGYFSTGSNNVFIGTYAGENETGSNKLYIDNSDTGTPLIYGDFENNLLVINGVLSVASSREYKENIDQLKPEKAIEILQHLNPVEFSYKATPLDRHTGFISEEVPESLTTRERKAVSPMDIVAVLTKVVQEQQKVVRELKSENDGLKARNESLENRLSVIEAAIKASR